MIVIQSCLDLGPKRPELTGPAVRLSRAPLCKRLRVSGTTCQANSLLQRQGNEKVASGRARGTFRGRATICDRSRLVATSCDSRQAVRQSATAQDDSRQPPTAALSKTAQKPVVEHKGAGCPWRAFAVFVVAPPSVGAGCACARVHPMRDATSFGRVFTPGAFRTGLGAATDAARRYDDQSALVTAPVNWPRSRGTGRRSGCSAAGP